MACHILSPMTNSEALDDKTLVAAWVLRTLGRALLVALVLPIICVAAALVTGMIALAWVSAAVGPVAFAWQLATASAPGER